MGCGPENPASPHVRVYRTPDGATADITFGRVQEGAPGLAHGGAVATAFDDIFGTIALAHAGPAVTASLSVTYHAPVLLDTDLTIVATLVEQRERKLSMRAWLSREETCLAEASAIFVRVDDAHFDRAVGR